MSGHVAPAASVARIDPTANATVGVDLPDGTRVARCLRCDLWLRLDAPPPERVTAESLPATDELPRPLRDGELRDLIVLRAIALERALHVVFFGLIAIAALVVQLKLPVVIDAARDALAGLSSAVGNTARGGGHRQLIDWLTELTQLDPAELWAVIAVSLGYAVLEAVEAVFLWRGRRWAEYLTVIATAGLLPLELWELSRGVSVLKALTLLVNLAIVVWLVWHKRLFGLRGGAAAATHPTDWATVLATPVSSGGYLRLGSSPVPDGPVADDPVAGDRPLDRR